MKKIFAAILVLGCISLLFIFGTRVLQKKIDSALSMPSTTQIDQPTPTPTSPQAKQIDQTLFVPYWTIQSEGFVESHYKTLVYFGIEVDENGINSNDDGYRKLPLFVKSAAHQDTFLTVRMIDSQTNFTVLKSLPAQDKIIKQSVQLAKKNGFKGILLNIEVSALPFASLVDQITSFSTRFATSVHDADLKYGITAYGDTFYRVRPFDMEKLQDSADVVYIMAYDFHKAKGNPGPNFPLSGNETYGYDYDRMINSFADAVPLSKLTVVFGLYGYDWQVDEKDVPQDIGQPLSLKEIKSSIIDTCDHLSCQWERDGSSSETKATYVDGEDSKHIVWFEDEESVKRKENFLKKKGIGSFAYWAYSYF